MSKEEFKEGNIRWYALIRTDPAAIQFYERLKNIPCIVSCYALWSDKNAYLAEISDGDIKTSKEAAEKIRQLKGVNELELFEIDSESEVTWQDSCPLA